MTADLEPADRWSALVGPTWAEVDLDAIAHNVRWVLGRLRPPCRLMAVVKANAYGHGAREVARAVLEAGASALGVSTVAEGLELREEGIAAPVLVLTPARAADLPAAIALGLTVTVADVDGARDAARAAMRAGRAACAHVKCDTGMGRYGFAWEALPAAAAELHQIGDAVRWEGVFTHFARGADAAADRTQLARFTDALVRCEAQGLSFAVRHAAASAAVLALPESHLDMVRVGNLLYGECPAGLRAGGLRRAFRLRSRVVQVRDLPAGAAVGYGGEWRARRPARVATLAVGFADGLGLVPAAPYRRPRVLLRALVRSILRMVGLERLARAGAASGEIWLGEHRLPTVGRVGMQQTTVDCGRHAVAVDDAATVHVPSLSVGARVARVYMRDGVASVARAGAWSVRQPVDRTSPGVSDSD